MMQKPHLKMQIQFILIKNYEDKKKNKCYLVEEKPGLIFTTTTKILLKFLDEDEMEMFKLYIQ